MTLQIHMMTTPEHALIIIVSDEKGRDEKCYSGDPEYSYCNPYQEERLRVGYHFYSSML